MQELDGNSNYVTIKAHSALPGTARGCGDRLSQSQPTLIGNRGNTKIVWLQILSIRRLVMIIICCASVALLTSCESESPDDRMRRLISDPGKLLATVHIMEYERHYVYKIHENVLLTRGDINFLPPPEYELYFLNSQYSGRVLLSSERSQIRRLLNRVMAHERGNLGLIESSPHVIIIQNDVEINFTYGMSDIRESDELISKVRELFSIEVIPDT